MRQIPVGDPTPADLRDEITRLWETIGVLMKRVNEVPDQARLIEREITFSYPGPPVVGSVSPVYHVRWPSAYITEVRLSAVTMPSNANALSTFAIKVNGTTVDSITLQESAEGGPHAVMDNLMIELEEWDKIGVSATAVPAGMEGVTIQIILLIPEAGAE